MDKSLVESKGSQAEEELNSDFKAFIYFCFSIVNTHENILIFFLYNNNQQYHVSFTS